MRRRCCAWPVPVLAALCALAGCDGPVADAGPPSDAAVDAGPPPTLRDVQAELFTPRCALAGCHNPRFTPSVSPNLLAPRRGDLVGVPSRQSEKPLVDAGNLRGSYVFEKVSSRRPAQGEPMPLEGPPLSGAERGLLRRWISGGALP